MKIFYKIFAFLVALSILTVSCIEEIPMKEEMEVVDPTLTINCRLIGSYSASFDCIIGKSDRLFTAGGFLYGLDPTFRDVKTVPGIINGNDLSIIVTDLRPDETYYVKAYVSDKWGEVTSSELSFESVAFEVEQKTVSVSYKGESIRLKVRTSEGFSVDTGTSGWIEVVPTKSTNSLFEVELNVQPNTSYEARKSEIKLTSKDGYFREKVTINQAGAPVEIASSSIKSFLVGNYDRNGSGEIELDEIPLVTEIEVVGKSVHSLSGIEQFYNLRRLVCKGTPEMSGSLKEADLKLNPLLEEIDLSYNDLTSMDISICDRLTTLNCSHNNLAVLDLNSAEILEHLDCSFNKLESLDLSYNYLLTDVNCSNNSISEFKSTRSSALEALDCSDNNISAINISNNKGLTILDCGSNSINNLNLASNTLLRFLDCSSNELTNLDMRRCAGLETLICSHNLIERMDIRPLPDLGYLDCSSNRLSALDLSYNFKLSYLDCSNNQLSSLELIGYCPVLVDLFCNCANMTTLYLEHGRQVEGITVNRKSSHISPNTIIRDHSGLATIVDPVFKAYLVNYFDGDGDGEISLDEAANISSINVCTDNIRTLKGIEYLTGLKYVKCEGSEDAEGRSCGILTEIDLSKNSIVEQLLCGRNMIEKIDVSKNAALKTLWCYDNNLFELDLSGNKMLSDLNCENNHISSLDLSMNRSLKSLDCSPMNDNKGSNCLMYLVLSENQRIDFINDPDCPRNVSNIPSGTALYYVR